jgi:hypothetical protein
MDAKVTRQSIEDVANPVMDKLGTRDIDRRGNTIWFDPAKPGSILMYSQIDQGEIRVSSWLTGVTIAKK